MELVTDGAFSKDPEDLDALRDLLHHRIGSGWHVLCQASTSSLIMGMVECSSYIGTERPGLLPNKATAGRKLCSISTTPPTFQVLYSRRFLLRLSQSKPL